MYFCQNEFAIGKENSRIFDIRLFDSPGLVAKSVYGASPIKIKINALTDQQTKILDKD